LRVEPLSDRPQVPVRDCGRPALPGARRILQLDGRLSHQGGLALPDLLHLSGLAQRNIGVDPLAAQQVHRDGERNQADEDAGD
jgi:hypothetical protein